MNRPRHIRTGQTRSLRGFSLLELVVAMGMLALLVPLIFLTVQTTLQLSNGIAEKQNEAAIEEAFFAYLTRDFSNLPGNTRMELDVQDVGSHYLSDITLQNVPMAFTWGGEERVAKAVRLSTVKRRDGLLNIVMRYYPEEILEDANNVAKKEVEPFAEVVLLRDVRMFEWKLLDGRTMEWVYEWDQEGRMPLQMELQVAFGAQGEIIRQVLWLPPKQNPEVLMRQLRQGGGSGGGGAGGGGGPGGGGGGPGPGPGGAGGGGGGGPHIPDIPKGGG